jgi:prephenate dehydrogenase
MATRLNRKRIGLIGRWLAMALLVAQFGAEVHLYSHPLSDSSEKLGAARTCGTCLASSQLQNAVAVAVPAAPVRSVAWVAVVPAAAAPETRSSPFRAFRSRAPPAFV